MEVLPVDLVALVAVIMGCLMFLIPIAGLTARYALKPMAEALARMREAGSTNETIQLLERRMALLEHEQQSMTELKQQIERLLETVEFEKQLTSPERARRGANE